MVFAANLQPSYAPWLGVWISVPLETWWNLMTTRWQIGNKPHKKAKKHGYYWVDQPLIQWYSTFYCWWPTKPIKHDLQFHIVLQKYCNISFGDPKVSVRDSNLSRNPLVENHCSKIDNLWLLFATSLLLTHKDDVHINLPNENRIPTTLRISQV